tara:strand:- start:70 stop:372 length:303 start_codon:yes stop_codon:yes gene_type:complete
MFDNIGTALVQAVGFFGVFGFFVYQLLSEGKKTNNSFLKSSKKVISEYTTKNVESNKKGLFRRKTELATEELKPSKKGFFGRKKEPSKVLEKPKKRGWFN